MPKIVAAKNADEAQSYLDESAIAVSQEVIADSEVETKQSVQP
jgi:hypothetical protein